MPMTTDWQVRREITATGAVAGEDPMRANALGHGLMFRPDTVHIQWLRLPNTDDSRTYTRVVTVRGPVLNKDGTENKTGRRASRRYDDDTGFAAAPRWLADAVDHLRGRIEYSRLLHFDGPTTLDRLRPAGHPVTRPAGDEVEVALEDGRARIIPARLIATVRGVDADGDLVVFAEMHHPDGSEYLIPLTPCCYGSGKGSEGSRTGVCCRGCYCDVDVKFGGPAEVAVKVRRWAPAVAGA